MMLRDVLWNIKPCLGCIHFKFEYECLKRCIYSNYVPSNNSVVQQSLYKLTPELKEMERLAELGKLIENGNDSYLFVDLFKNESQ